MENSQVIIRPARPEEGEALAVIEATCFPPAEAASREAVLERLATFPENFLVAEIDGKPVGFINGANTDTQYLPDAIRDRKYYTFGDNKTEQAAAAYWRRIKDEE